MPTAHRSPTCPDNNGELIAVDDADGNKTLFNHNSTNRLEVVIDRLGRTNSFLYDLRGNVLAQTDALNQITTMAYDGNNNKTNSVVYLNGQPYATNAYFYDTNNLLLLTVDPLGHTNGMVYDGFGNMLISTDARGVSSTNYYDLNTGNLLATSDAYGHGTTNTYGGGLLLSSQDALGTITLNFYDATENLVGMATVNGSTVLSSNVFGYDADGNRISSTVWRRVNTVWTAAQTTFVLDGQNRGGTNH